MTFQISISGTTLSTDQNSTLTFFNKFMFSKKATKIDEIFTVNLTSCSKSQIHSEDFINFMAFLENANFTEVERMTI